MEKVYKIGAAVLVGGKSLRMKSRKDLLKAGADTDLNFLDRLLGELEGFEHRYISVNSDETDIIEKYSEVVVDKYIQIGPMGGIASVLENAKKDCLDAVFFVAVDMPNICRKDIESICLSYSGQDALISRSPSGRQPLASLYSVSSLDAFKESIESKHYKIANVIENLDYEEIGFDEEYIFVNINTIGEYRNYIN